MQWAADTAVSDLVSHEYGSSQLSHILNIPICLLD